MSGESTDLMKRIYLDVPNYNLYIFNDIQQERVELDIEIYGSDLNLPARHACTIVRDEFTVTQLRTNLLHQDDMCSTMSLCSNPFLSFFPSKKEKRDMCSFLGMFSLLLYTLAYPYINPLYAPSILYSLIV